MLTESSDDLAIDNAADQPRQIDFYVIENSIADGRLKLASRLANKMLGLNKKTLVVTTDAEISSQLDQTMWAFSDTSFVPHDHLNEAQPANKVRVTIAELDAISMQSLEPHYEVLINLCAEVPPIIEYFPRILEIVENNPEAKNDGRNRFKHYQQQGCNIRTHKLEI